MGTENKSIFDKYFQELYLRSAAELIFFARKFVDFQTAEDIVHDVFLKIWDSKSTIIIEDDIKNYIITMVKNACMDHIRRQSIAKAFIHETLLQIQQDELSAGISLNELNTSDSKYYEKVSAAIEKLPPKRRAVFKKAYLDEQKNLNIAQELNISVKTVETHLYKALKYLREHLNSSL